MSLLGLASVGMSIGFSYGFCSLIGLAYGPLHNMIPFLLLGIGDTNNLTSLLYVYAYATLKCKCFII